MNGELASLKGELEAEEKKAEQEFPLWVKEMTRKAEGADVQVPDWKVAPIEEASSDGKETFEPLEDGSVLATGKPGDRSTYLLKLEAGQGKWKALRLEALLHKSMQKKGPGRNVTNANPNFVLTEILVYLRKGDLREPIALNRAWAGFSQANFGAGQLIDGKLDSSNGWAIAPRFGENHQAYFEFGETLDLEKPARLEIEMKHLYGGGRNVGRPRISLATVFPPEEKKSKRLYALAGKKKRSKADEKELKKLFLAQRNEIVSLKRRIGEAEGLLAKIKPASTLVMVEMNQTPRLTSCPAAIIFPPSRRSMRACRRAFMPGTRVAPQPFGLGQVAVDPGNPLVARVTVNRWWGQLLERGSYPRRRISVPKANPPLIPGFLTGWPSSSWRMAGP